MPDLLTAAELVEIEDRLKTTTEGPWKCSIPRKWARIRTADRLYVCEGGFGTWRVIADAEFCAHARTDLPRAVATIRALAEAVEWSISFVQEPDYFPNPGDAQSWREHLDATLALARRVLGVPNA